MIHDLFEEDARDVRLAPGAMLGHAWGSSDVRCDAGHHLLIGGHRINLTFRRAA